MGERYELSIHPVGRAHKPSFRGPVAKIGRRGRSGIGYPCRCVGSTPAGATIFI
jgi:hypothetical protein